MVDKVIEREECKIKIEIEIPDEEINKAIIEILSKKILSQHTLENRTMNKYGIADAVKEIVYTQKEELIERCVERASTELVKKAFPQLMDKLS